MSEGSDRRQALRWAGAVVALAAATGLMIAAGVNQTAAGLVFLTLVVWFSSRGRLGFSIVFALACAIFFDFFFIPPVRTLRLAGPQEWVEILSFLICSLVVGRLAERARAQTRQAEQRREDVERLYEMSQETMLHEDPASLIRALPSAMRKIFALDIVLLYVSDQDEFYSAGGELPMGAQSSLRAAALSPNPAFLGTEGFAAMPLLLGMRTMGALGWSPAGELSREVATAVGAQVALALTRSIAIEAFARIEASREGERLRTALIDSLTHELRTPLTSIRAAATTLLEGSGLDEAGRRDLAALVDEEASRLDVLIGEAVEMAEIDAHVLRVSLVQRSPRAFLEQAVDESGELLARHPVTIAVEGPDAPAWFDPHLLGRVLRHLLENAARYTPPGSRIELASRRAGDRLEFSVHDEGPGIDSLDMPLIFEKFYRGKKGAALGKGSGMGLAIARAILAAHGGGIEASSVPGKGATFRFWVPLVEKEPAAA